MAKPDKLGKRRFAVSNHNLINHLLNERPDLSPRAKLVALALAGHRNAKTLACHPSFKRLEETTGYYRQSLTRAIRELEVKRVVIVRRNSRGKRGRAVNHYLFLYDANEVWKYKENGTSEMNIADEEYSMLICRFWE